MKQLISYLAAIILGIGVGYGIGTMVSKSKLQQSEMRAEELLTQMQTADADAKKKLKKAMDEAIRHRSNLSRNQNEMLALKAKLKRAEAEMVKFKNENLRLATAAVSETPEAAPAQPEKTAALPPSDIATKEYTIEENDSLWKIAEKELGDGTRYKEILEVNPGMTETQALKIGMKIKIPTQ